MPKQKSILDNIPVATQAKSSKPTVKTVAVVGTSVSRFAKADSEAKAAKALMTELSPTLQEVGVAHVFQTNSDCSNDPKALISSVNLVDANIVNGSHVDVDGSPRVQFSWVKRNLKNDPKAVEAAFKRITNLDGKAVAMEDYCHWAVKGEFNTEVFSTKNPTTGDMEFDENKYKKFVAAIEKVAKALKVEMPLTCSKVLVPKPDFHQRRFRDFDVKTNVLLMSVLPTSLALEAITDTPA